jgi:hypothetical protein
MKKPALLLTVLALSALPSFGQVFGGPTSEFGVSFGGSTRRSSENSTSGNDVAEPNGPLRNTGFSFRNRVTEIYYSVAVEPDTRFKIKAGQIESALSFRHDPTATDDVTRHNYARGTIQHVDGLIDYRFTEAYGTTGLFAGVGLYRQTHAGEADESAYGFSGGVNGDFPMSRRTGFVVEATYHRIFFDVKAAEITLTGGFRFSF